MVSILGPFKEDDDKFKVTEVDVSPVLETDPPDDLLVFSFVSVHALYRPCAIHDFVLEVPYRVCPVRVSILGSGSRGPGKVTRDSGR